MKPKIGIFGAGWVGLVTGACFAELGHEVVVRDVVPERIEALQGGRHAGGGRLPFNVFHQEARRLRRENRYAVSELREVPAPSFGEGLSTELEEALAELSRAEREVVALRIVLELDGETASRVLGISRSACSTRLSRALQKLEGMVSADAVA